MFGLAFNADGTVMRVGKIGCRRGQLIGAQFENRNTASSERGKVF
jgi:hypothetical protein